MKNETMVNQLMQVVNASSEKHDNVINEPGQNYQSGRRVFDFEAEWKKGLTEEQLLKDLYDHIDTLPWKE